MPQFAPLDAQDQQALVLEALGRGQGQAPVQRAQPQVKPQVPMPSIVRAAPLQAPAPGNFMDAILQALSSAGPEFMKRVQARQDAGLAEADAAIARMQANNKVRAESLSKMKLGAEAVDAMPKPAKPIDPLELFGGPTPEPEPVGTPTPQQFMNQHNARTPSRPTPKMAPQAPLTQPMQQTQLMPQPVPPPIIPPFIPRVPQARDKNQQYADIALALGERLGGLGGKPLEPNWLKPTRVPARGLA